MKRFNRHRWRPMRTPKKPREYGNESTAVTAIFGYRALLWWSG